MLHHLSQMNQGGSGFKSPDLPTLLCPIYFLFDDLKQTVKSKVVIIYG